MTRAVDLAVVRPYDLAVRSLPPPGLLLRPLATAPLVLTLILRWLPRLASLSLLVAATAQAQPVADHAPLSLSLSLGPSAGGGAHVSGSAIVQRGRVLAAAQVSVNELSRVVATGLFGSARDHATDLSALVGYAYPVVGRWQATGLIGVSAVQTTRRESRCVSSFLGCVPVRGETSRSPVRMGLPVEVGVHGPVAGAFGMGVRAFVNANPEETYGGVSVDFRLSPARGRRRAR